MEKFMKDNKLAIGAATAVLLTAGIYYYSQSGENATPVKPKKERVVTEESKDALAKLNV
jgi:hypothetical protein